MPVCAYGKRQVEVARSGKTQGLLEQDLPRGRGEEIRAANHVGDTLCGIVDRDGKLISREAIASVQHERTGRACYVGAHGTETPIVEVDDPIQNAQSYRARSRGGRVRAGRRMEQLVAGFLRPAAECGELAAAAAAVQCQSELRQSIERRVILRGARALAQDRPVPFETKSIQIGDNLFDRTWPFTRRVEILDAQQPSTPPGTGLQVAADGREERTEMEWPRRARGEAPAIPARRFSGTSRPGRRTASRDVHAAPAPRRSGSPPDALRDASRRSARRSRGSSRSCRPRGASVPRRSCGSACARDRAFAVRG